ncbi:hypothetical protein LTR17_007550 [Elasticomyces elasticus]|nr:hypothetical protein LTR17_007550 [Elasticomyces elasticus]
MAAAQQVLNLPDLLEPILLSLPMRDLLFAQKVCKTWKAMIDDCSSLQKALFFIPGKFSDINLEAGYQDDDRFKHIAPNPLLFPSIVHRKSGLLLKPKLLHAEAHGSCSRMLITQPPDPAKICWEVVDRKSASRRSGNSIKTCTITTASKVTLGALTGQFPELGTKVGSMVSSWIVLHNSCSETIAEKAPWRLGLSGGFGALKWKAKLRWKGFGSISWCSNHVPADVDTVLSSESI